MFTCPLCTYRAVIEIFHVTFTDQGINCGANASISPPGISDGGPLYTVTTTFVLPATSSAGSSVLLSCQEVENLCVRELLNPLAVEMEGMGANSTKLNISVTKNSIIRNLIS